VAGLVAGSGGWRVAGGTCGSNMLLLGCDSGMGAEHRSRTRARRARQQGLHRYTLRPKIFALVDFCASLLTIRLIRKNYQNVIYFAMTFFIVVYILSIS
jgi:hypothetical protein